MIVKSNPLKLFAYGTLKPGETNYDRYCKKHVLTVEAAVVQGQLYSLPLGYPAMTVGSSPVYGFILSFADLTILTLLDELEDYSPSRPATQNEYIRTQVVTFSLKEKPLGLAWIYQMQQQRVQALKGTLLPSGIWTGRLFQSQYS